MLEKLFLDPTHPGVAHYIIHAYDYPDLAERARRGAESGLRDRGAACGPHAFHTYVLLGRWKETIESNTAAEQAEKVRGVPEDRIHDLDYLVLAYLQLAQDAKATEAVDLARATEDDMVARKHDSGLRSRHYNLAALEARWGERADWAAAAALPLRLTVTRMRKPFRTCPRSGLARSGHPDEAQREIDQLAALVKARTDAKNPYWAGQVEIQRKIAAAWTAHALGHEDEALALMQAASKEEDGLETHDTLNPGPIGMTADEGLGMLLLELKRPAEVFKAFEASLRIAKNRRKLCRSGERGRGHERRAECAQVLCEGHRARGCGGWDAPRDRGSQSLHRPRAVISPVMRGVVPRIHVFGAAARRGWPGQARP
jgi:hypothetical protein